MKNKFIVLMAMLLFLLIFGTSQVYADIINEDVGYLDELIAQGLVENSDAAELAWIQGILGSEYSFFKYDTNGENDDGTEWTLWETIEDYYALELQGEPEYFFIKIGTGNDEEADDHFLYSNLNALNWAIVDGSAWDLDNYDIYRISHIGVTVPEPHTMLLLGTGLIGLAAFGRKRFRK